MLSLLIPRPNFPSPNLITALNYNYTTLRYYIHTHKRYVIKHEPRKDNTHKQQKLETVTWNLAVLP